MVNKTDFDVLVIRDYYPSVNNPTSSTWVYNQVIGLQEMGYKPLVISPTPVNPLKKLFRKRFQLYDTPSIEYENYLNTTVIRPPYLKIPRNKLKGLTLRNLSKVILKHGVLPDIKLIHAHFGQNGVASLPLKEKLKVPLITSFYGYDAGGLAPMLKRYYNSLMEQGDVFTALSYDMRADLTKIGFPEKKILIHKLGIDLEKFTENNFSNDKFTIVSVARLSERKGIQYVLKAIHIFFQQYPEEKNRIIYKIVGGGVYEARLKVLTKELSLEKNVIFINNLIASNGRDIVLSEMKECDLFILCSAKTKTGDKEGTPVVLMEAQACGKSCISTFHAGIPEVVIDNETGILVKEHSDREIFNAIETLYFDKEKRFNFGMNAKNHIKHNYNQCLQMKKLVDLYKYLISK